MKLNRAVILLTLILGLAGCSKSDPAAVTNNIFIPATVADLENSREFTLEHTTDSGIKCYTRHITPDEYHAIPEGTLDQKYLVGSEKYAFLAVPVKDGQILELNASEVAEVAEFTMKKLFAEDSTVQDAVKRAKTSSVPIKKR